MLVAFAGVSALYGQNQIIINIKFISIKFYLAVGIVTYISLHKVNFCDYNQFHVISMYTPRNYFGHKA